MNSTQKVDAAMKLLENDKQLAADFDRSRKIDFPTATTRRQACELGLKAIEAKQLAALAAIRAKAMKYSAATAVKTFKKAVAVVAPITKRPTDKRVGALPYDQWAFGHLTAAAEAGDKLAVAELTAQGYSQTSNNTYSKLPV
jgi:hypothetical protein